MSSAGSVNLQANARFNRLENAFARVQNRVISLETRNAKLTSQLNKMGNVGARSTNSWVSSVGRAATAYIGLSKGIDLAVRAFQRQMEIGERAAFADITLARADEELGNAMGDFSPAERQRLKALTRQTPRGFTEAQFTAVVSEALSQTSGETPGRIDQAIDVSRAVAPLFQHRKEEAGAFAGAVIDVERSVSGEATPQQLLALMATIRSQSALKTIESLKEFVPAAAAADVTSATGDRLEQLITMGAVFSAMTGRGGDTDGSIAKTAAANLAAVLREELPDFGNFTARLEAVAKDPKLATRLVPELMGRAATKPIAEEILRGGISFKEMTAIRKKLAEAVHGTAFQDTVEFQERGTPALIRSRTAFQNEARVDQMLREQQAGIGMVRRELFGEKGAISNAPGIANFFRGLNTRMQFEMLNLTGVDPMENARDAAKVFSQFRFGQQDQAVDVVNQAVLDLEEAKNEQFRLQQENQKRQTEAEKRGQVRGAATMHAGRQE